MLAYKRYCTILIAALAMALLLCGAARAEDAELSQAGIRKGVVATMQRDGMTYIALDDMLSVLGFAKAPTESGIVATFSGRKIEFWDGSAVARVNGMVYSMPGVVYRKNGHWWGEAGASISAMNQFLTSAGRPSPLALGAASAPASDAPAPTAEPAPAVVVETKPTPAKVQAEAPTPAAPAPAAPAPAPVPTQAAPAAATTVTPTGDIALLTQIRWGEQTNAYRVVIDLSKRVDVKITHGDGELMALFSNTLTPSINSTSPWKDYYAASRQQSSSAAVVFKHAAKNVKGFWLEEPSRYVIDFYFDRPAKPNDAVQASVRPSQPSQSTAANAPAPSQPTAPRKNTRPLVVVDAGHGGHDPGAVGNSLREKDINLKAALELEQSLKRLGMDVKLTRRDDRYLKLGERTEFANRANADIFISLHCNALPKGRHATGTELYLMADSTDKDALNLAITENRELSGNAQSAAEINEAADKRTKLLLQILGDMQQNDKINESTGLAEELYNKMRRAGIKIRNVRQAPFFVLRGAGMPALLVEMGYITEKSDANNLNSAAHRKKMLDAAAEGIRDYLRTHTSES